MALVQCPECSNQISSSAPACPQCGFAAAPAQQPVRSVQVETSKPRTFLDVSPAIAILAVVVFGGIFSIWIFAGTQ